MSEYEKKWYTKEDYLQYHCFNKKDWWYSITRSLNVAIVKKIQRN